jgi:hypothetical protein
MTSQIVPVSRQRHAGKAWAQSWDPAFAASWDFAPLIGSELGSAFAAMPIAFLAGREGYQLVAILSFTPGQNLFVGPNGSWLGLYVPAAIRSYPFQLQPGNGSRWILCVDEASGQVVDSGGDAAPFFNPDGTVGAKVKGVTDMLEQIERGRVATENAVAALAEAGVIHPWDIRIRSEDGEVALPGIHRIDEAALNALDDEAFMRLHRASALPVAYSQLLSLGQLRVLERLYRHRHPSAATAPSDIVKRIFDGSNESLLRFE